MFFFHNRSAINTLNPIRGKNAKEVKKIKIDTLNNLINKTKFANSKIDFLTIDVEGYEMNVLKGFDIKKYSPDLIVIEFMDLENKTDEDSLQHNHNEHDHHNHSDQKHDKHSH